jgi:hypothetical protein
MQTMDGGRLKYNGAWIEVSKSERRQERKQRRKTACARDNMLLEDRLCERRMGLGLSKHRWTASERIRTKYCVDQVLAGVANPECLRHLAKRFMMQLVNAEASYRVVQAGVHHDSVAIEKLAGS